MIRQQIRAPNEGDRVGASGRNGTFEVVAVSTSPVNMVKLMLLGKPDFTIDVPWGLSSFSTISAMALPESRRKRLKNKSHRDAGADVAAFAGETNNSPVAL